MKSTLRKVVRYLALIALVVGLVLVAYGAIVNQVAMKTFLSLLNQGGFKAFAIGILLVVAAIVMLLMSLFVGRGKGSKQSASKPAPAPQSAPVSPEGE